MFLEYCQIPFAWSTTIISLVLVSCIFIGATVCCDIALMYSALYLEETWAEATPAFMLVVNLVEMMGNSLFWKICT